MSYLVDSYHGETVAAAPVSERVAFIRRTYAHVAAAVVALVAFETVLIGTGIAKDIVSSMFASNFAWLGLMVVFIGGTFAAQYVARSRSSVGMQYAGLALYVLLYGVLFMPILTIASLPSYGGGLLPSRPAWYAGSLHRADGGGLRLRKDFSSRPILGVCTFLALGVIIAAIIGGFSLGWCSVP